MWGFPAQHVAVLSVDVNSNTGWRTLNVGGNYNETAGNGGLFYFNANNNSSNSNANLGARHLVFKTSMRRTSLTAW